MRTYWLKAGALLAAATSALASGYGFYEQDAEATGQAGASIARADNPSASFYNPAGLATQPGGGFSMGGTITTYSAKGTLDKNLYLVDRGTVYKAYMADSTYSMPSRNFFPAHVQLSWKIKPNMAFGFFAGAPFALGTQWGDGNNPFKYMASNTDLRVVDYSPSFAMSHRNGTLAWAVGADYYDASATFDQVFDLGQKSSNLPSPPYPPGTPAVVFPRGDNSVHVDATGHKLGWHVGLQWKPTDAWRVGLVYRGKSEISIGGPASYNTVAGNVSGAIVAPGQSVASLFPNQSASTVLPVPATGGLGIAWIGKRWETEFDATYQGWSVFKNLTFDFSSNTCLRTSVGCSPVLTDRRIKEDWKNTWAGRLGAKWKGWDHGYLGMGVLYDQNPVPSETLRSLLPDGDRAGVTAGAGAAYEHLRFDFSVMWLEFQKRQSNPQDAVNNDPNSPAFNQPIRAGVVTEHETSETLKATYKARALLFGLNVGYRW